jgi:hypothetical protein
LADWELPVRPELARQVPEQRAQVPLVRVRRLEALVVSEPLEPQPLPLLRPRRPLVLERVPPEVLVARLLAVSARPDLRRVPLERLRLRLRRLRPLDLLVQVVSAVRLVLVPTSSLPLPVPSALAALARRTRRLARFSALPVRQQRLLPLAVRSVA